MIDILGDRFIGMFKEQTERGVALRLEVDFTPHHSGIKWTVFNENTSSENARILVVPKVKVNGPHERAYVVYHVIGMEGVVTFEDLIKHSKQIIDFNMEIEDKKMLMNEKFAELTELFTKHSIDELRNLQFVFPIGESIYSKEIFEKEFERELEKPQPKKRKPRKTKEKVVEDVVLEPKEEEVIELREVTVEEITEKVTAKAEEGNLTEDDIKDLNGFREKLGKINEKKQQNRINKKN